MVSWRIRSSNQLLVICLDALVPDAPDAMEVRTSLGEVANIQTKRPILLLTHAEQLIQKPLQEVQTFSEDYNGSTCLHLLSIF